ncbi:MAG: Rieske (2Fe-2S) domain protein [Alphaproteobacteria bacterium]|nr:Rieske (2Fe-2S) domain protein [Alphaproteobacteria bacterium]
MRFLCKTHDIPLDEVRRINVPRRSPIAVYRLDDGFYASDDRCSHGAARLSDGEVEDGLIICPLHYGSFDIRTGAPGALPCAMPMKTYRLIVEGDDVFLAPEATV